MERLQSGRVPRRHRETQSRRDGEEKIEARSQREEEGMQSTIVLLLTYAVELEPHRHFYHN